MALDRFMALNLADHKRALGGEARARAYKFMSAVSGDLPGFEEAARSLFANDGARLNEVIADLPPGVRTYVLTLPDSIGETST